ncbi:MAG: YgiQ family radical SAM protein [Megasphaera sp.]|jgi:uncharacterized radical SAM protein YgiQ|nr:YgiQ family radical SAM protein [Megasphaera sp.]MCI1248059.1 YgiQ family radical SAM protein [Megasphaera sp.]
MKEQFLVTSREDMERRGWKQLDFVYINGDAYVDHPAFAAALIGRVLESRGYRVGIISQPDWHSSQPFKALGKPRLGALITAGNLDSMLNEKTAAKKFRNQDNYSPGGEAGHRPERATIVYANRMREAYKDVPIIIGGIEASLRRFAHYDYWSDKIRHSILLDSKADILSYGMGEHSIVEIADALAEGKTIAEMYYIRGICYASSHAPVSDHTVMCPSYEDVRADKEAFSKAFKIQYEEQDPYYGKTIIQPSENRFVIQTPPALPLTTKELDEIYELPFQRRWHPDYDAAGGVPALKEVQFDLTSHRGCFGHCHFCAITSHQGRIIQSRSHESLLREAVYMTHLPGFKGYIHDVGGPTANFRHPACAKQLKAGACRNKHCIGSEICPNLDTSHADYMKLLREIRNVPGIKKVFVRSGLRYDYVLADNNKKFVEELCHYHVSGQLKVAPEHVVKHVTDLMGKADIQAFLKFKDWFDEANRKLGKKQYLVPYFMSSHPGCTLKDAIVLAEFLRDMHMYPEQVQDFIPTPGSLSTAMYYTGMNPLTGKKVYVARRPEEKQMQRALMQYSNPANYDIVHKALCLAGRRDLIGYGEKCLISPQRPQGRHEHMNLSKRMRHPMHPSNGKRRSGIGKHTGTR